MSTTQTQTFIAYQLESGQWRAYNTETGRFHGQAFRYQHEAAARAAHLEAMHA